MGVEIDIKDLTKSFGKQLIWGDVSLTIPAGEICVMLGPSGTGKSVLLKTIIGLLKPDKGRYHRRQRHRVAVREGALRDPQAFGVLFQDGALFGSMNLYDNIAFPLREHTKKSEKEIRDIVMEKLDLVGLLDTEDKLPGEISGGMRKRAGLARALVLDPEIVLFDEPDSGLDPVRTSFLNELIVDLNAQIDATFLIVTHDINTARTVPDNIGLLYHKHLAMFGPREMLLSSEEPVVRQFLNAQRSARSACRGEGRRRARGREGHGAARRCLRSRSSIEPSNGQPRRSQREPGSWCKENGSTPPPGSFEENMTMTTGGERLMASARRHPGPRPDRDRGNLFAFSLEVGRTCSSARSSP